ncbi:MAG: hypothetical protein AAGK21_00030 [Bacteroidota bacterium]
MALPIRNHEILEASSPDELLVFLKRFAFEDVFSPISVDGRWTPAWHGAAEAYRAAYEHPDLSVEGQFRFERALSLAIASETLERPGVERGLERLAYVAAEVHCVEALRPLVDSVVTLCSPLRRRALHVPSIGEILDSIAPLVRTHPTPSLALRLYDADLTYERFPYLTTRILCRARPTWWPFWSARLFHDVRRGAVPHRPAYFDEWAVAVGEAVLAESLAGLDDDLWEAVYAILFQGPTRVFSLLPYSGDATGETFLLTRFLESRISSENRSYPARLPADRAETVNAESVGATLEESMTAFVFPDEPPPGAPGWTDSAPDDGAPEP